MEKSTKFYIVTKLKMFCLL